MEDVILGILAILVGLVFCFRGYLAMRVIIPIWGAFAGFMLGAGLVASIADEGFLASLLGWLVGFAVGFVFGLLAYLYYEISVFIAMGAIGYVLGATLMVALGVTWSWLIVLVGVGVGILLGVVALIADLPMILLTVLTALAGASTMVTGTMLLVGLLSVDDLDSGSTTVALHDEWWWYAIFGFLAIAGIVIQVRSTAEVRASMREAWSASGGRQLREA